MNKEMLKKIIVETVKETLSEGSMKKTGSFKEGDKVKHKEDNLGTGTVVSRSGNTVGVRWSSGMRSHDHNMLKLKESTENEEITEAAAGIGASEFRKALINLAKDAQAIQKVNPQERELLLATIIQLMDLAKEGNITTGTIGTLISKVIGVETRDQKADDAAEPEEGE